jgi:hypothetical protein
MTFDDLRPTVQVAGERVSLEHAPVTINGQRVHHLDLIRLSDDRTMFVDAVYLVDGEPASFACVELEDVPPRLTKTRALLAYWIRASDRAFMLGGTWSLARTLIAAQTVTLEPCAWNDESATADFFNDLEQAITNNTSLSEAA